MRWTIKSAQRQDALDQQPYDRWMSPDGVTQAAFYRVARGLLLRFPHQADFLIEHASERMDGARDAHHDQQADAPLVTAWPHPDLDQEGNGAALLAKLYHNAVQPMLGNHTGGLFLHGSAVRLGGDGTGQRNGAAAFLGLSRGGKTTLAGSFARAGHPFLTEDVIDLHRDGAAYWLQPKASKLRLFADSARHLLGADTAIADDDLKQDVDGGDALPFADKPAPLRQIYVLGTDHAAPLAVRRLSMQQALAALMPHAFVLDVEDKGRVKAHFTRMAELVRQVECYALDFTRSYDELPAVHSAILANFVSG